MPGPPLPPRTPADASSFLTWLAWVDTALQVLGFHRSLRNRPRAEGVLGGFLVAFTIVHLKFSGNNVCM